MVTHNKGEVWEVSDRHGQMTIKLEEDVDESKDSFFNAVILEGKKSYMSRDSNDEQKYNGKGTAGHIESFRTGLCSFVKRKKEMEK